MKSVITALFLLSMVSLVQADEVKKLVFAPLPTQSKESVVEMFTPLVRYLEKALHVSIEYRFSSSYAQMLESMEAGAIDIAYLGPLPYLEIHAKRASFTPIVFFNEASKKPFYTCTIVAWDASKRLSEITPNDRFALTDPLSTCGYFSVERLLGGVGKSLAHQPFTYIGKHDLVALEVIKGHFEFGGIKNDMAHNYAHLGLEIVAQTEPVPAFALVVDRKRLSSERIQALEKALLEAEEQEYALWHKSMKYGLTRADDSAYEAIRRMQQESHVATKAKE